MARSSQLQTIDDEDELKKALRKDAQHGLQVRTRLQTSERVLARVTDGIYREPSSALRELIANAYDADAHTVSIITDAPRFETIVIRDDGIGMSADALARMTKQIGGSAKRTGEGKELGITSAKNPDLSPAGRPLIGKIGIGLFSVSQLAQRFKIITKEKGSTYRIIADVRLRTFKEGADADDAGDKTLVGEVLISKTPTTEKGAHGTEIVLEDMKPGVRDLLRSADTWRAVDAEDETPGAVADDATGPIKPQPPIFHSGWIRGWRPSSEAATAIDVAPNLPWSPDDPAPKRMEKLFEAVAGQLNATARPDLATTLDNYLRLLWSLALASPVEYLDEHPFEKKGGKDAPRLFWLSNLRSGQATEIKLVRSETVREAATKKAPQKPVLQAGSGDPAGGFRVLVDGVELRRPIRLEFSSPSKQGLQEGLLAVGKYSPDISNIPDQITGGPLSFEGYLYWGGRVAPKENNGVLIRIRGASGALFDETFFKYQVSELTRLRQIVAEIFVQDGLDAALNIDRESFNYAHPHAQFVSRWVHSALRQLINKHKELSSQLLKERRVSEASRQVGKIQQFAERVWERRRPDEPPPDIEVVPTKAAAQAVSKRRSGHLMLIANQMPSLARSKSKAETQAKMEALAQVLSAYGVLDSLTFAEQQALIDAIVQIFEGPAE